MANDVTFECDEYTRALEYWDVVDDACAGSIQVKKAGDKRLPRPNPTDTSKANKDRFDQYKKRAVYENVSGHTLRGLTGAAFRKAAELDVPTIIDYVKTDIDGSGLSIYQQSRDCVGATLKGRSILLVDYPSVEGKQASAADITSGKIRATTMLIDKRNVKNWRTVKVGAAHKLALAPIFERIEEPTEDGFGVELVDQYRVLKLINIEGSYVYTQEIWRKNDENGQWLLFQSPVIIKDGSGAAWDVIPIIFVGPNNNDLKIDDSPMYDLAEVNLAHYRNSAEYEDSIYMIGQPQPWMSGLTEEWRNHLEKEGIYLGARTPWLLPENGSAGLLQAEPNTIAKEGMDQKENQMIALGARMLTPGAVIKTVSEAESKAEIEHSVLSLAVSNVSAAYTQCLEWMLRFMNSSGKVSYKINQEFTKPAIDAQMLTAITGLSVAGKLPDGDLFNSLKKHELIDPEKSNEDIKDELDSQSDGPGLDEE